jgi:hypothetical protein
MMPVKRSLKLIREGRAQLTPYTAKAPTPTDASFFRALSHAWYRRKLFYEGWRDPEYGGGYRWTP